MPFVRSCFDLGVRDRYSFVDGVIWPHSCDNVEKTYDVWKRYVKHSFYHYLDVPHMVDPSSFELFIGRGLPASCRLARDLPREEFNLVDLSSPALFIEPFKADGIVISMLRSCRGTSIGQTYLKRKIQEQANVPVLILETDICDVHAHSEADIAAKFDAFFETLETRNRAGAS